MSSSIIPPAKPREMRIIGISVNGKRAPLSISCLDTDDVRIEFEYLEEKGPEKQ